MIWSVEWRLRVLGDTCHRLAKNGIGRLKNFGALGVGWRRRPEPSSRHIGCDCAVSHRRYKKRFRNLPSSDTISPGGLARSVIRRNACQTLTRRLKVTSPEGNLRTCVRLEP